MLDDMTRVLKRACVKLADQVHRMCVDPREHLRLHSDNTEIPSSLALVVKGSLVRQDSSIHDELWRRTAACTGARQPETARSTSVLQGSSNPVVGVPDLEGNQS